jgi:hypothetical protein
MSVSDPAPAGSTPLIARVQGILMSPRSEWDKIEGETATPQGLFTGYAMILAAIPAVAQLVGGMFPTCVLGACFHRNPIFVVVAAVLSYALTLVGTYAVALVVNEVAPSFGGQKNSIQALKLVVYSWTAGWVAGILGIVPMLGILTILGVFYGLYLFYVGAPKLMKVPEDKAVGFTAVTAVIAIVVYFVIGLLVAPVLAMGVVGGAMGTPGLTG